MYTFPLHTGALFEFTTLLVDAENTQRLSCKCHSNASGGWEWLSCTSWSSSQIYFSLEEVHTLSVLEQSP